MLAPKTKDELARLKKEKENFYRQIKEVILPGGFSLCRRLFIGGCIERGVGSSFRHKAHAHCFTKYPNFGVLCFRKIERVGKYHLIANNDGSITVIIDRPSCLLLHEYAHLLAPNQAHNKTFYRRDVELKKIWALKSRVL